MFYHALYLNILCDQDFDSYIAFVRERLETVYDHNADIIVHNIILLNTIQVLSGVMNIQVYYDLWVNINNPFKS